MTLSRKLLALSAVAALSFSFTACDDDSGSSDPTTPVGTKCTQNTCVSETVASVCDLTTGQAQEVACTGNEKCVNGACKDPSAPATCTDADNTCKDDSVALKCNATSGQLEEVACTGNEKCVDGACKVPGAPEPEKCTAAQNTCKSDTVASQCDEANGEMKDIACTDNEKCVAGTCVKQSCAGDACLDNLTLNKCNEDGSTTKINCAENNQECREAQCQDVLICKDDEKECTDETHFKTCANNAWGEPQECGQNETCSGGKCSAPVVVAETIVGRECSCTGDDCQITITGKEIKAALSTTVKVLGAAFIGKVKDTDTITAPNFFSKNIKGCEDLEPVEGLDVGCFYTSSIDFPKSIAGLTSDIDSLLGLIPGLDLGGVDISSFMPAVTSLLEAGIKFEANKGYCMLANININFEVTDKLISSMFVMDNVMKLVNKINTPSHNSDKASNATCPEGSSLIWFKVESATEGKGNANVDFDMCLKACKNDDDCRTEDGYTCEVLPQNQAEVKAGKDSWTTHACFPKANMEYFQKMTDDFNNLLPKKDEETPKN